MPFNPMTNVPETDEEALIALERNDVLLTEILRGLYRIFRARNETVLGAFRLTLEAHVEAANKAKETGD